MQKIIKAQTKTQANLPEKEPFAKTVISMRSTVNRELDNLEELSSELEMTTRDIAGNLGVKCNGPKEAGVDIPKPTGLFSEIIHRTSIIRMNLIRTGIVLAAIGREVSEDDRNETLSTV
jgi:hypothetical protein